MEQQELTDTQRFTICICGALLPSLMECYRLSVLLTPLSLPEGQTLQMYFSGIIVRMFILILSAILYCYFFGEGENHKARLFFDGMAAPSMLLTLTTPITQANNLVGL